MRRWATHPHAYTLYFNQCWPEVGIGEGLKWIVCPFFKAPDRVPDSLLLVNWQPDTSQANWTIAYYILLNFLIIFQRIDASMTLILNCGNKNVIKWPISNEVNLLRMKTLLNRKYIIIRTEVCFTILKEMK